MLAALQGVAFRELWSPSVFVTALVFEGLYLAVAAGPARRLFPGSGPVPWHKILYFTLGIAVYFVTFGSPVDFLSDEVSFSVHMIQHLLEVMVMTPLLLLGMADWMVRPVFRWAPTRTIFGAWVNPWAALIVFNLVFAMFHLPVIYDETLSNEWFHFFEHLVFFIVSLPFWWPIVSPLPEYPRLSPGWRMLYTFFSDDMMLPVSVYLSIANHPVYAYHYATDFRLGLLGLSPLADQQLGGIIMLAGSALALGWAFVAAYLAYDERTSTFMA